MLTRPDDAAPVASNTTADAPADSPATSVEPPVPVPESSESIPVETSETTAAPEPTVAHFEDLVGDTSLSNKGALTSSSADVRAVHVHGPAQGAPGWVVVKLSNSDPGVGVILRIDTDNDRWPDLTAWQHTETGALGSFQVVDWSHGNDILQRSSETDEHFVATGHQAPETGVAFPLVFRPGEIAGDRLRLNVQTVNDDLYYDYFPSRQRWTATTYVVAP